MTTTNALSAKRCIPCEGGTKPLAAPAALALQKQLDPRWRLADEGRKLEADFEFKNYFRTLAFVNAAAYIAISEDHHPEITFGYKTAKFEFSTHAIGGLSENDFICAAKLDALLN
ncbi:MAG: 4a-hydroxytetrahydrobiopterin dehydratase [Nevskia sp.]|nr:4a-hydroxytetrahydrobiopterin dehydratase [Nevskia sp.]